MSTNDTHRGLIGLRSALDLAAELSSLSRSQFHKARPMVLADVPTIGRLGDYHLLAHYQGGMSDVYVCLEDSDAPQPPIAFKTFRQDLQFDAVTRRAFRRECALWARASIAPGILPIWGLQEIDGCTYLRMPGVLPGPRGEITLRHVINRGPLSLELIVFFARMTATALCGAATAVPGLVHGDLKPSNMLMMWGNCPLISDFGIARAAMHGLSADALRGTLAYCSPLARDPKAQLTVLDDVYSYGVILEELLTYRVRKSGNAKTTSKVAADSSTAQARAALLALARQCCAVAPAKRPEDFRAIVDQLDRIASEREWPIPSEVEAIPNPVVSTYRINSVARTLIQLDEFESALEFIGSTNGKTRHWELWAFEGVAFSAVGQPAHAISSYRKARAARNHQNGEPQSTKRDLEFIAYFLHLAYLSAERPRKAARILHRLIMQSTDPRMTKWAAYSLAVAGRLQNR